MSNEKSGSTQSTVIGFLSCLTIAFIVLKLCGVIAWSWFWVLSPIIIPTGVLLLVLFVLGIFMFAYASNPPS